MSLIEKIEIILQRVSDCKNKLGMHIRYDFDGKMIFTPMTTEHSQSQQNLDEANEYGKLDNENYDY